MVYCTPVARDCNQVKQHPLAVASRSPGCLGSRSGPPQTGATPNPIWHWHNLRETLRKLSRIFSKEYSLGKYSKKYPKMYSRKYRLRKYLRKYLGKYSSVHWGEYSRVHLEKDSRKNPRNYICKRARKYMAFWAGGRCDVDCIARRTNDETPGSTERHLSGKLRACP